MPGESYTDDWTDAGMEWADGVLRPVREEARAHPWLGVAAALAAGAMLGAMSRPKNEIRIRLAANERLIIGPRPESLFEEEEEEHEEEAPAESPLRRLVRSAGEPLRRLREEESTLERFHSALRSGMEELAGHLPRRTPPSRMQRLRDALEEAIPGRRPQGLTDRLRRAMR